MRTPAQEKNILRRGEKVIQWWEGLRENSQQLMAQSVEYENTMRQVITECVQMAHSVKKTHDGLKSEMIELTQYLNSLKARRAAKQPTPAKKARTKA
jgi:hypothetical protein